CLRPQHRCVTLLLFFSFSAPATPEISTLSLHDALPIWRPPSPSRGWWGRTSTRSAAAGRSRCGLCSSAGASPATRGELAEVVERSEEHTSELQSRGHLVCRLLLEKKNNK